MIRFTLRLVLTSLLGTSCLLAQRGQGRPPEEPNMLQIETLTLASPEASKGRLDVLYRIPRRFFVFVRPEPVTPAAPFVAHAEIAVELFDTSDRSIARDYSARTLSATSPQAGGEGSEVGQSAFLVPPGHYTLYVEIRDHESSRIARSRFPYTVPALRESSLVTGILFCAPAPADSSDLAPLNEGGDIPFGARADAWFQLASGDTLERCSVQYRIVRSPSESLDSAVVLADTLAALPAVPARSLVREEADTVIRYHESGELLPGTYRLRVPLKIDTLMQARYTLFVTISAGNKIWHASKPFSIRWFDMPMSLRFLESAIEPMEYLLTPDEYKQLRRSDTKERKAYFDAYWKARDNTPATAYNEVLTEFYRRVDYARRTFNTLKVENGAKTERGKAYILYGPPSKIDRTLLPTSSPQEIWYYPSLERKLTFVDRGKTGDYVLVAAERL